MPPEPQPSPIEIVIDGEDDAGRRVSLETVGSVAALRIAATMFELAEVAAATHGEGLDLRGLELREGSAAIRSRTARDVEAALLAAQQATRWVRGADKAPPAAVRSVERARGALSKLTATESCRWELSGQRVDVSISVRADSPRVTEVVRLRAKVLRAGGKDPTARLESPMEPAAFTLRGSEDKIRKLGEHLYRVVEVEAEIVRETEGDWRILGGKVLEVFGFDSISDAEALESWLEAVNDQWRDDLDVERVLAEHRQ